MTTDEELAQLAGRSREEDAVFVRMVYHDQWVTFDMSMMELKYLPIEEIVKRYFVEAFAAIHVPTSEQQAPALTAPSATNV